MASQGAVWYFLGSQTSRKYCQRQRLFFLVKILRWFHGFSRKNLEKLVFARAIYKIRVQKALVKRLQPLKKRSFKHRVFAALLQFLILYAEFLRVYFLSVGL